MSVWRCDRVDRGSFGCRRRLTPSEGVQTYFVVVLAGTTIIAVVMHALHVSVGDVRSQGFILAAMWMPGLARLVATRTVDRGWHSPFPLRPWGQPAWIVIVLPLASVTAIYVGANLLASVAGVVRSSPTWSHGRLAANVVVNLPLLSAIGIVGALGEEIGLRSVWVSHRSGHGRLTSGGPSGWRCSSIRFTTRFLR